MKIMAVANAKVQFTPELMKEHLPKEVPATLQLYLDGKIEQFWFREGQGPIFLMTADSVAQAEATLRTLPFVAHGYIHYDLWPVGPLVPLGTLIQSKSAS